MTPAAITCTNPSYMNREVQQRRSAATGGLRLEYTSTCGDGRETERYTYSLGYTVDLAAFRRPWLMAGGLDARVGEAEPCCCGGWIGGAGP